ncbi:lysophospholipid acyltransferase family protein [Mycoplana sp. MJR14]|uniref:lysophospholipid acyltransferase family protein n=1 Tax=Mycoplana sp. MJR14 TaxID=3032583 RepID=UPI0023DBE5C0|nr:lysophospholipid acyltransferase family protein [Mycoplana sp. MJR14]MDF1631594.1 lysophospholipid acyltransferase family protein [Mycoplana sp. MJR14]
MVSWLRIALVLTCLTLATLALLPAQLVCLRFDLRLRRRIPRLWHRAACALLGLKVRVHGTLEGRRPLMLAANHASWKDILVLGSIADVVYIAKSEVRDWPVFGLLARLQASIFVVREERRKTGEQVGEIARRMADGEIVVLFPEGTTSDGNRLLEVKTSLFGAAATAAAQVPGGTVFVQPVSIAYTGLHGMAMGRYHRPIAAWPGDIELLPHLLGILKEGAFEIDVDFGEMIPYDASGNRKALSRRVEQRLRTMLGDRLRAR